MTKNRKLVPKQIGGNCQDRENGYCELQFDDENNPIVNKNGLYRCRYKHDPRGDPEYIQYYQDRNAKYCHCKEQTGRCQGKKAKEVPYVYEPDRYEYEEEEYGEEEGEDEDILEERYLDQLEREKDVRDYYQDICEGDSEYYKDYQEECDRERERRKQRKVTRPKRPPPPTSPPPSPPSKPPRPSTSSPPPPPPPPPPQHRPKGLTIRQKQVKENYDGLCDQTTASYDLYRKECGEAEQKQVEIDPEKYCHQAYFRDKYDKYCRKYFAYRQQFLVRERARQQ